MNTVDGLAPSSAAIARPTGVGARLAIVTVIVLAAAHLLGYFLSLFLSPIGFDEGFILQAPLNLVQWVGQGEPRGLITPMPGAQISFLIGDFRQRARTAPAVKAPTADGWPLAIPGPSTPHDMTPPTDQPASQQDPGDQRLAIPADEPPPREAPPQDAPLAIPYDQAPPPP